MTIALPDPRRFVDFQAQAMAGGMDEQMVQAMACEHTARGSIHARRGGPRANGIDRGKLGLEDRLIHAFHFGTGSAYREHARHVAGVAVLKGPHIDDHKVAGRKARRCWLCMGQGRADSRSNDGFKARLVRTQAAHAVFQLGGEIAFAGPGLDAANGSLEGAGIGFYAAPDKG